MLIKKKTGLEIPSSEITPEHVYKSRRQFMKGAALLSGSALLAACRPARPEQAAAVAAPPTADASAVESAAGATPTPGRPTTDELGQALNTFEQITTYNNFYEFTTDKRKVASMAKDWVTSPWDVEVTGLVRNPGTYSMETLLSVFEQEERIYRLRCVEAWSMVIPWEGFSLNKLLKLVEPTSDAKYVKFTTINDPDNLPGMKSPWYEWPYTEGLRLDEAMHDLTLMATGIYGEQLLPQNGAPIRLVVPWKYGLKSIKSIVKIELTDTQPVTLWNAAAPREYGFYGNVNPNVDHPRWTQATERRIGQSGRIPTLMFNGYEEQVASLYEGMDLTVNF